MNLEGGNQRVGDLMPHFRILTERTEVRPLCHPQARTGGPPATGQLRCANPSRCRPVDRSPRGGRWTMPGTHPQGCASTPQ